MRIASLISAGTEMLFALGLGEQVVAVSHECDWPEECRRLPRVTQSNIDSSADSAAINLQVRELLASGTPLYEVDAGKLAELEPDLILTQAQCDVCAVEYADVVDAVQRTPGLSKTRIMALNPQSLADVLADMIGIGAAAGVQPQAQLVVTDLERRIEKVRASYTDIPPTERLRIAIVEWTDPLMLAGNWVPELIQLAGGRCELTPPGEHSRSFEWDELLQFDPEVVIVCPCGFDADRSADELQLLTQRSGWSNLTAVQNERAFAIDGNAYFNRPGPRLVDSLEIIGQMTRTIYGSKARVASERG